MSVVSDVRKPDLLKAIFLAVLFICWEGLPAVLLGLPVAYSQYPVSALVAVAVSWRVWNWGVGHSKLVSGELIAIVMLLYMIAVSVIYSGVIAPQDYSEWVFSMYQLLPVALIVALRIFGLRAQDAILGVMIVGLFASVVVVVDGIAQFPVMEAYQRTATTDESLRRIVFLKTETAFALGLIFVRLLDQSSIAGRLKWGLISTFPVVSLFLYSESRSAIAATLLGVASYVLFVQKGVKKYRSIALGFALLSFVGPYFLDKYIDQFMTSSDYFGSDQSNSFRVLELIHFYNYFIDTGGFGFGSMSIGEGKSNIIAWSSAVAGYSVGTYSYGLQLSDLGLYAALFQFGVIGFLIAVFMTYRCVSTLVKSGMCVSSRASKDGAVLGLIMLFFELNPWPVSFFTLNWSIFIGGVLWFIGAEQSRALRSRRFGGGGLVQIKS